MERRGSIPRVIDADNGRQSKQFEGGDPGSPAALTGGETRRAGCSFLLSLSD